MFKLLLSWDVIPEKEHDYFEFMSLEFTSRLTTLGITPIEAWFTMYGKDAPQVIMEGMTDDLETMKSILGTDEWQTLSTKLQDYVTNFTQKVIRGRSHLQL